MSFSPTLHIFLQPQQRGAFVSARGNSRRQHVPLVSERQPQAAGQRRVQGRLPQCQHVLEVQGAD